MKNFKRKINTRNMEIEKFLIKKTYCLFGYNEITNIS